MLVEMDLNDVLSHRGYNTHARGGPTAPIINTITNELSFDYLLIVYLYCLMDS
jgi:hypothetical protein